MPTDVVVVKVGPRVVAGSVQVGPRPVTVIATAKIGPRGPQGEQGDPGVDGADGESAYAVAVENGFVGTEADWLASLVGPQGDPGNDGADGAPGVGLPAGGTTGQFVAKASDLDYDYELVDPPSGGGGGAVDSVNGQTGVVVLDASDVGAAADDDPRLSDARTPTAHAASHQDGGSDELALDGSQITTGTVADARIASTIARDSEVTSAVDAEATARANADALLIPLTQKAAANGVASLDGGGKVPVSQLPNSIMEYQGTWNASTNTPTLADGSGSIGDVYRVTVAGSQNLGSGAISFSVGDYAVLNSSLVWEKSDTTDAVASVNGLTGAVTLDASDVGAVASVVEGSDVTVDATDPQNPIVGVDPTRALPTEWETPDSQTVRVIADPDVLINATAGYLYLQGHNSGGASAYLDLEGSSAELFFKNLSVADGQLLNVKLDGSGARIHMQPGDTQVLPLILLETDGGTLLFRVAADGSVTAAGDVTVPDEAYDATAWNGSLEVPTKNAVRDEFESLSGTYAPVAEPLAVHLTGDETITGNKTFRGIVAIRGTEPSGKVTAKVVGDTADGVFNLMHDGDLGYLFHLTTGPNMTANALIGMGIDYAGTGIMLRNKNLGIGMKLEQWAAVSGAGHYGLWVQQSNTSIQAVRMEQIVAGAAPVLELYADATATAGQKLFRLVNSAGEIGYVDASSGAFVYKAAFQVQRASSGLSILTGSISGDSANRFQIGSDGKHEWGSGSGAVDTNLYRSAADTLKTDDALIVVGALTVASVTLTADDAYDATSWNGSLALPTKNAVRDKIEVLAPLASPALTGTPTAPTAAANTNSTQVATTAYSDANKAGALGYVNHGATAGTARPSGYGAIHWVGSVEPTNAVNGDLWTNTA